MLGKLKKQNHRFYFHLITQFVLFVIYAFWSYGLTDPNLVLINHPIYWNFQQWMWQNFFNNSQILALSYVSIIISLFINYFLIIKYSKLLKIKFSQKKILIGFLFLISPLFFSYNALSHDIFNYIFNAKMVINYQANPHIQTAIDFPDDLWTRFMHNTHTPAPYWYGWTFFSLLPYLLGLGKFITTWLSFRAFNIFIIYLLYKIINNLHKKIFDKKINQNQLFILFLNPLFLIEIISNIHNDLWMLIPAIYSLSLITTKQSLKLKTTTIIISILMLIISISTKIATLVLLPIWFLLFFKNNPLIQKLENIYALEGKNLPSMIRSFFVYFSKWISNFLNKWWPTLASIFLFIPLFTSRSQQFHPWYLTWSLVWIPFIKNKIWRNTLLIFSMSSMIRYIPWLSTGEFNPQVLLWQKFITWSLPTLYLIYELITQKKPNSQGLRRLK